MTGSLDIAKIIVDAKLGSARKDAQVDTCTVFAAALHHVLTTAGVACDVWAAEGIFDGRGEWGHMVVKVGDQHFDSLGLFDRDIVHARSKVHKNVEFTLRMKRSVPDYDEEDFEELHAFYVLQLSKSLKKQRAALAAGQHLAA